MPKRAVLLVNLGSPDSPSVPDVRRYLDEFLGDERVIDKPAQPFRSILFNGIIIPRRAPKSAHAYEQIWTKEGSPLIVTSRSVQQKLAAAVGTAATVYLAMRYGTPSIASVLTQMAADGVEEVLLFPQYPHYAMSSWETVVVKVQEEAARVAPRIKFTLVQPFYADADYIDALHAVTAPYLQKPHDYVLFSYHGLPVRQVKPFCGGNGCGGCEGGSDPCPPITAQNAQCYRAQCYATSAALIAKSGLTPANTSTAFQSRLKGATWLHPFTDEAVVALAQQGVKRLAVACPAFVADCLETLEEIAVRGREVFQHHGGEELELIPCLNDHSRWIDALVELARETAEGTVPQPA